MSATRDLKIKISLENVKKVDERYSAVIRLKVSDKIIEIPLTKLAREPKEAWASINNEYLRVELFDSKGVGFASCLIHLDNLEKRECRSLLIPTRGKEE